MRTTYRRSRLLARISCAALACTVAAVAGAGTAAADGGDLAGSGPLELTPVAPGHASVGRTEVATGHEGVPTAGAGAVALAEEAEEAPITGTTEQLGTQRARVDAERLRLQSLLLHREQARFEAEAAADDALDAIATRLVELFDAGQDARVAGIVAAREAVDEDARTALVAALVPADRVLFDALDAARAAVDEAAAAADQVRADVLAAGTRIAAIDAVLQARRGPDAADRARARGKRFSVDADYVFATGPIPDIGYWGAASGGGMLSGWMGYAGAAVGGVGCTPPDPSLRATGTVESGEASWYGPGFQGNATANGETFDTGQMTAAHKTLPFGTIVRVYSSATARCAFVRINDRGPYVDGRVIDLSRAAADAIGMESIAPVQLEVYAPS